MAGNSFICVNLVQRFVEIATPALPKSVVLTFLKVSSFVLVVGGIGVFLFSKKAFIQPPIIIEISTKILVKIVIFIKDFCSGVVIYII
ncbi:MAG: hypothetical protein LBF15_05685 [Candidatus Peribacteria bacterium]|nr:hypothetical protein [Candidatus Peribacteria bacterium]